MLSYYAEFCCRKKNSEQPRGRSTEKELPVFRCHSMMRVFSFVHYINQLWLSLNLNLNLSRSVLGSVA